MDKPVKVKKEMTAEKKAEISAKRKETLRKKKLEQKEMETQKEIEDKKNEDVELNQEDINRIADEVDEIKRLLDEKEKKRNNFINKTPEEKLLYLYDKLIILDIITNNQMILDRMMGEIIRRHGYEFVKEGESDNSDS
jgi:hypothetical protein